MRLKGEFYGCKSNNVSRISILGKNGSCGNGIADGSAGLHCEIGLKKKKRERDLKVRAFFHWDENGGKSIKGLGIYAMEFNTCLLGEVRGL